MSVTVASRMEFIVKDAARPVLPGENIKAQLAKAWANLGKPTWWRVVAAWKGEGGSWSASAAYDFESRYTRLEEWREKQKRDKDLAFAADWDRLACHLEGRHDADLRRAEIAHYRDLARAARVLDRRRHLDLPALWEAVTK